MSSHQHRADLFETGTFAECPMTEAESKRLADEFAAFWVAYPLHVGRLLALKAYAKARKTASADVILAGVDRYLANKPAWQQFAHPSSWLNAGRWDDEFVERRRWPRECPHTPACPQGPNWQCIQRTQLDALRKQG